jgi:dephospho-CoA kinase
MDDRVNHGTVLGLVGPVCTGKSAVSRRLRELGAEVYEADKVVHGLYAEPAVKDAVRALFGDTVFEPSGAISRSAIAAIIFAEGGEDLKRRLTSEIIFPRTGEILQAELAAFRSRADRGSVFVVDAPTLFEAGRDSWCDQILLVTAPLERRQAWAAARGWPPGELARRDSTMLPEAVKRQRATYVIENTGSPADLVAAVDRLWDQVRSND